MKYIIVAVASIETISGKTEDDPGVIHWGRGPHQDFSDFLYSGSTDENPWILFYFQVYALEQRSWMVLKLFFIFWKLFFG